jgi:hypothetical protein
MPDAADLPPPDDPAPDPDAELIAYLDGELAGTEAQQVEARLALDPSARTKAEAYKKTFDLLDYLPRPEPTPDFATRTLTRLQPAAGQSGVVPAPAAVTAPRRPGWLGGLAWLAATVIAAVGGYAGHAALRPYLDRPARGTADWSYADARVIDNLPLYLGVDDLDFLRTLDDPDLFAPDPSALPPKPDAPRLDAPPANRERLEAIYAAYPPARRQQLRDLDQQLRDLPAAERDQLGRVLEGYAVWLDRLPDPDRKEVLAAPAADARLEAVRRVKEKAWRDALPAEAKHLLKLAAGDDSQQLRLVEGWKNAERARREEWQLARRQWDDLRPDRKPWPFAEEHLAAGVDEYVKAVLKVDLAARPEPKPRELPPAWRVTWEEYVDLRARYAATQGGGGWEWFSYGLLVYRLSERHPYLPPFGDRTPLTDLSGMPGPAQKEFRQKLPAAEKRWARGKWPEFALDVERAKVKLTEPLGPSRPGEFAREVNDFLRTELAPKLTDAERDGLKKLEGRWPEYPRAFLALAAKHDLPVPGVTLPGKPSLWARFYSLAPPK